MHYEINVSHDGIHYFATAQRSITRYEQCVDMVRHFRILFPTEDGYKVTASERNYVGKDLNI
jgi:hypothetical protein